MNGRGVRIIGVIIYLVLIGISLAFLYNAYTATDRNPSALASAAATTALVLLTAFYVYFTWKLANESEQTRRQAVSPAFVLDFMTASQIEDIDGVRLINTGHGPAYDVDAKVHLFSNNSNRVSHICGQSYLKSIDLLNTPNVRQNHYIQVDGNPFEDILDELGRGDELQLEVSYTNQLGRRDKNTVRYTPDRLTSFNEAPVDNP